MPMRVSPGGVETFEIGMDTGSLVDDDPPDGGPGYPAAKNLIQHVDVIVE